MSILTPSLATRPPVAFVDGAQVRITPDMLANFYDAVIPDPEVVRLAAIAYTGAELLAGFEPGANREEDDPERPPLMHYGFTISHSELLACVKRLHIAPRIYIEPVEEVERTFAYALDMRDHLLLHLFDVTGHEFSIFPVLTPPSEGPEPMCVLSLYTNYSKGLDGWSAVEAMREKIQDMVTVELEKPGDGASESTYDAKDRLKWYWDAERCGYGYSAPWDEFNPWPAAENSYWCRTFIDPEPDEGRAR